MNSSREREKLSERLIALASYHKNQDIIWDIGCDHAKLGLSFLNHSEVNEVHLVDPSGPVIEELNKKIKDSYITKKALFIHHQNGQTLKIQRGKKNLIFVAGMGGKEASEIILALMPQLDEKSTFVISPHRKILELRLILRGIPLTLLKEEVIFEDGQYYQILSFHPGGSGPKVSPYGEDIWKGTVGAAYREHQLRFFTPHRDLASLNYVSFLKSLTL